MATTPEANLSLSPARKPLGTARRLTALLGCAGALLAFGACGQKGPLVMPPAKAAPAASQPAQ